MNPGFIILTVFNIASAIINVISLKHFNEIEKYIEKKSHPTVVPVAEVKAQFSEENMKMIRELLKEAKHEIVKPAEVESKKCTCDHFYDSVYIDQDIEHCCERMIFHCERCNHEEIIPIKRGLLTDTLIRGGF